MRASVVYVHHNCFLLELNGRLFLFDHPAPSHLPSEAAALVRERVRGRDLTVVISHGHEDHFDPNVVAALSGAAELSFIVSDDVPDMYPEALPEDPERVLVMEPDERREFRGLTLESLESNDLGLAYWIEDGGASVYFGGDLADWSWEGLPEAARAASRAYFDAALAFVKKRRPDVAFSNLDKRLPNLAGGLELARTARARLFTPMHAFGDPSWLGEYERELRDSGAEVFLYEKAGDAITVEW